MNKIFLSSELNYTYALLTISCNTVAIFKMADGSFRIFDSHARDLFGASSPFGKCILITASSIQNLVSYFQIVSAQGIMHFEIKAVNVYLNSQVVSRLSNKSPIILEHAMEDEQSVLKHNLCTKIGHSPVNKNAVLPQPYVLVK